VRTQDWERLGDLPRAHHDAADKDLDWKGADRPREELK
jgi:hypothetical protein